MAELHELNGSSLTGAAWAFEPITPCAPIPVVAPFAGANPEIVDLVREAQAAGARVAAASSRRDAILKTATARPAPPEALFKRTADNTWTSLSLAQAFVSRGFNAETALAGRRWFGEPNTIETLRQDGNRIADGPVGQMEDGTMVPWPRPNEAARARITEILAAYDAWQAAIDAWKVASGYAAAWEEWDSAVEARLALWPKLAEAPARTLADFALKASAAFDTVEEVDDVAEDNREGLSGSDLVGAMMMCDAARVYFVGDLSGTAQVPQAEVDAPLVEAWKKRCEVFKRYEEASQLDQWHLKAYAARGSALAQLFRPRGDDFADDARLSQKLRCNQDGFYTKASVDLLRKVAATPSPHQARAIEIVQAYDGFSTPTPEHEAAVADLEAVATELHSFDATIRDTPALSLRGIGIKAAWALTHKAEGERDVSGVLQQIEAFTRRHAYMDTPNVPALERDVMGGLPCADWHLYCVFTKWWESANTVRSLEADHDAAVAAHGEDSEQAKKIFEVLEGEYVRNWAFRDSLRKTRAASTQGVQLKAIVYAWCCHGDEGMQENEIAHGGGIESAADTSFAFNIAREIALLGVPGVLDTGTKPGKKPDDRALQSYRAWLEMEYRSLTHEMYPDQPDMLGLLYTDVAGARFHFRDEPPASSRAERILDMFSLDWRSDNSPSWKNAAERAA